MFGYDQQCLNIPPNTTTFEFDAEKFFEASMCKVHCHHSNPALLDRIQFFESRVDR